MGWSTRRDGCLCLLVLCAVTTTSGAPHGFNDPAPEFSQYKVIHPRLFHTREKREVTNTRERGLVHINDLVVTFDLDGKQYVMDLQLNRDLIPNTYFERYQHNGKNIVNRPVNQETELCEYQGTIRGSDESWVAVSTCDGLRGIIFDGKHLYFLENGVNGYKINDTFFKERESVKIKKIDSHVLYNHLDLVTNYRCDHQDTFNDLLPGEEEQIRNLRAKRNAQIVRTPYNANKTSRFVELVLVVDNGIYKAHGENLDKVYEYCKNIANIVNALYLPLNIFIALVGVEVWTENDEINFSSNGDVTLVNFLNYRRRRLTKDHHNDNAQLLTKKHFEGGVVGKALKGPICTHEFSGGVVTDSSSVVGLVATSVAHMLGHNFGMEHDTAECVCPGQRCIMARSISTEMTIHWSSCSREYLDLAFRHGMDYCLRNKPRSLFGGPVCGNGFVEAGEECDCGLPQYCDNPCCNSTTCMLYSNASCATGECCDLKTCHLVEGGTVCRSADHECDLPEFCTGQSEYCPDDVYKMDGEMCKQGMAYCYQGSCQTHSDQCQLLWGPTGKNSDLQCYQLNKQGNRNGNCGYDRLNNSYHNCAEEAIYCGLLQCVHTNDKLEFGLESVAILSRTFIHSSGKIIPCKTALIDLGINEVDPGLVPNGAKCGDGKMCINQKCVQVSSLQSENECRQNCNGNGICDNRGQCHCNAPLCENAGPGDSEDRGSTSTSTFTFTSTSTSSYMNDTST